MSYLMKVAVVGDEGVGKRSLITKFVYPKGSKKIITEDAHWKSFGYIVLLRDKQIGNQSIRFQMWILKPLKVRDVYYYGVLGAIVVFDVTNRPSFTNVQKWITQVWEHNGRGTIPITIVGTKTDLRQITKDAVSTKEGEEFATKMSQQSIPEGIEVHYCETSIFTWDNEEEKILQEFGQSYLNSI
ncbi:MAG: GTP-binding protein [Candidatus Hodarchaeales archaeon]